MGYEAGGRDTAPGDALFPARRARSIFDGAGTAVVRAEDADAPPVRFEPYPLRPRSGADVPGGVVYAHFARVFVPHSAHAAVGGDPTKAAVGENVLPAAPRKPGEAELHILPEHFRYGFRNTRRAQLRGGQGSALRLSLPDHHRRAG